MSIKYPPTKPFNSEYLKMRDYITLGSVPCDEVPLFDVNYSSTTQARESRLFLYQLSKNFPPPEKARLTLKSFPHDFGTYVEVVCYYDTEDQESIDYAFKLEDELPEKWDRNDPEVLEMLETLQIQKSGT